MMRELQDGHLACAKLVVQPALGLSSRFFAVSQMLTASRIANNEIQIKEDLKSLRH
jgi:hypothetical protein